MSNQKRAEAVIRRAYIDAPRNRGMEDPITPHIAQALADAGLLMPDDMATEYGIWHMHPQEEEEIISWERDRDLSNMLTNLRNAGWKAERVARHVSPHRFTTITKEPN